MTVTNNKMSQNHLTSKPFIGIILIFSVICELNIPILVTLWRHGFDDGTYSHAFLIPFISLYLYYELTQSGKLQFREKLSVIPTILLILSCYLLFVTSNAQISVGYWIALLAVFITSVIMLYKFNWYVVFPAAFLVFIFPFWGSLTYYLQAISVSSVSFMMSFTNIPTYVEAQFVSIPAGTFEIADGCSGLRYLIVSLAISSLFIFLNIKSKKRAFIFFAVAVFGGLFTNWLRIMLLIIIGDYTDMTHSLMNDHNSFGWYIYAPFMLLLFYFGNKISDHNLSEHPSKINNVACRAPVIVASYLVLITVSSTSIYWLTSNKEIKISLQPKIQPVIHDFSHLVITEKGDTKILNYTFDPAYLDNKPTYYENSLIPLNWNVSSESKSNDEFQALIYKGSQKAIIKATYKLGSFVTGNVKQFKIQRLKKSFWGKQEVELIWAIKICSIVCE